MIHRTKRKRPIIWILLDKNDKNNKQSISLAENFGKFKRKYIEYNILSVLPNTILSLFSTPKHIAYSSLIMLQNSPAPDMIICTGRRLAILAIYLKRFFVVTKIVQIMNPEFNSSEFDLVVLSQHDLNKYKISNVIRIVGVLNNIKNKLPQIQTKFKRNYPESSNYIAVIMGGSNKNYKFTMLDARILINSIDIISKHHSLSLFIIFTNETSTKIKEFFKERLDLRYHRIYDPKYKSYNPYPAVLHNAEYIICTGDSLLICSDVISAQKTAYIYIPRKPMSKRHKSFILQIVDMGLAKILSSETYYSLKNETRNKDFHEMGFVIQYLKDIIKNNEL